MSVGDMCNTLPFMSAVVKAVVITISQINSTHAHLLRLRVVDLDSRSLCVLFHRIFLWV